MAVINDHQPRRAVATHIRQCLHGVSVTLNGIFAGTGCDDLTHGSLIPLTSWDLLNILRRDTSHQSSVIGNREHLVMVLVDVVLDKHLVP